MTIETNLSTLLADLHQLYIKTLGYHWNIRGPRFYQLHLLFEKQYEQLAEDLDTVAEQIRKCGANAPGTIQSLTSLKRLKEKEEIPSEDEMIKELASDYDSLIKWLTDDINAATDQNDFGTADMLTDLLRDYQKTHWFLKSHLG